MRPARANWRRRDLPHNLHADLDLSRQNILRRDLRRKDAAERGAIRVLVDLVASEIVVVQEIKSLHAKLRFEPFRNFVRLQQRCIRLEGVIPSNWARTARRVPRMFSGIRNYSESIRSRFRVAIIELPMRGFTTGRAGKTFTKRAAVGRQNRLRRLST